MGGQGQQMGGGDVSPNVNLFSPEKSTAQKWGDVIMNTGNQISAQQSGPEEQQMANIGNSLVNHYTPPQKPTMNQAIQNGMPNLFQGWQPTMPTLANGS